MRLKARGKIRPRMRDIGNFILQADNVYVKILFMIYNFDFDIFTHYTAV